MKNLYNIKLVLGLLVVMLLSNSIQGQQDPMYTHYLFNLLGANPGYAGSRDVLTATALHRTQWAGFEGAPTTQTFTLHSPVLTESLGVGLSVINDKIGPVDMISLSGDIAARVKISRKTKLAFGLKFGFNRSQIDLAPLEIKENDDQFVGNTGDFLSNVGFGFYFSNEKWFAGASAPKILENDFESTGSVNFEGERRHYYVVGGFISNLNKELKLKPSVLLKAVDGAPIEIDFTALFIVDDEIELGLMTRTANVVGLLIGYNFSHQLRLGYSFDWSFTSKTGDFNSGSHEVMLRYDIINLKKKKVYSPRYF